MANDSLTSRLLSFVRDYHELWKDADVNEETTKMVADAKALLDEAETAPFRYTMKYRPPTGATLPRDPWKLVEIPKSFSWQYRRPDLSVSAYPFGVVEFERPLSVDELAQYEMVRVW